MQKPALELSASRLFAAWLCVPGLGAIVATLASNHPPLLKGTLLAVALTLLLAAWRAERRRGLRYLGITTDGAVAIAHADGTERTLPYAGHAVLGRFVVFVFTARTGWRRLFGPERHAVMVDAADPDEFRRLRAWVRLGL